MKYTDRVHGLQISHGYRSGYAICKCGWLGGPMETMSEILIDYQKHLKERNARI